MLIRGILLLAIVFSIGVCFFQPKMHTPVLIYKSDYEIVEKVPVVEKTVQEPVKTNNEVKKETHVVVQTPTKKIQQTPQTVQKTLSEKKTVQTSKTKSDVQIKQKTEPKTVVKTQIQQKSGKTEVLTKQEQEEIIAWNRWHSNLQNSIMKDVRMPNVPNGTKFNFTFTVDKYGRISDIRTWSDNPEYTIYAIQYIGPIIKSYQGKSILDFPQNSQRIVTKFEGRFRTSTTGQNKYSTESDFNDTEKIRK